MAKLYDELAHLWPLLSPPSDYEAEAASVLRAMLESWGDDGPSHRRAVLELGAGGGHTLHYLAAHFDTTAVDLSQPMLDNCRRLSPSTRCIVGDMRDVRPGETFDGVLIHDAIDYLTSEADIAATMATAGAILSRGGVLIVAPTYTEETFADHEQAGDSNADQRTQVHYVSHVRRTAPGANTFELAMVILIRESNAAGATTLRIEEDRHTCGLFPAATWVRLMEAAGFEVRTDALVTGDGDNDTDGGDDAGGRGISMFIGVKR